ncbi:hypothetical protein ABZP36_008892 [Zizania latifolia]
MRKPTFSVLLDLAACDGDDAAVDPSLPLEGLCCPDDPLDEVINLQDAVLDYGFLESLEVDVLPSPRLETRGGRGGDDAGCKNAEEDVGSGTRAAGSALSGRGSEVSVPAGDGRGKDDAACKRAAEGVDVDAPAAEVAASAHGAVPKSPLMLLPDVGFDAVTAGAVGGMSVASSVPRNEVPALPDVRCTTLGSSPGKREHSSPSSTVPSTPPAGRLTMSPASPFQAPAVPCKRRRSQLTVIRKRAWSSLDSPLHLVPVAVHPVPVNSSDEGGGGGSYQRRVMGRKRNRQGPEDRRCSHCHTSETPQWRMGPNGPGTLCNACGIRHKMGKLLPEYMPTTSPGFKSGTHSNRHRKVLKLREQNVESS